MVCAPVCAGGGPLPLPVPTINVYAASPKQPALSVARTVKLALPAVVGVPVSWPSAASDSPCGSAPETSVNVYGEMPPLAVIAWV
jgi:hypothetical protein